MSNYNISDIISVQVSSIEPYGVFVNVDDTYTGLIHISQINGKYISDIDSLFNIGDIKKVKILGVDNEKKQLKLSMIGVRDKKRRKKYNNRLEETKLGFELFEEILPEWLKEKIDEIEKNEK